MRRRDTGRDVEKGGLLGRRADIEVGEISENAKSMDVH